MWLSLPHTETTLGGAPEGLPGLALEPGVKSFHPRYSGHHSVQVSAAYPVPSPGPKVSRAATQPQQSPAPWGANSAPTQGGDHPLHQSQWVSTHSKTIVLPNWVPTMLLRSHHHTASQSQLTHSRVRNGHPECCRWQTATPWALWPEGTHPLWSRPRVGKHSWAWVSVLCLDGAGSRMATAKALWAQGSPSTAL